MRVPTIKELMHEQARFVKYEDGKLWYQTTYVYEVDAYTDDGRKYIKLAPAIFDFPIPVNDAGGGEFGSSERLLTLMRWARKHIEFLNQAQKAQDEPEETYGIGPDGEYYTRLPNGDTKPW